jgi:hypothetical protein
MWPLNPDKVHKKAMIKKRVGRRVEMVVVALLSIVALAHLVRLITGAELPIAGTAILRWISFFGCVGPAT